MEDKDIIPSNTKDIPNGKRTKNHPSASDKVALPQLLLFSETQLDNEAVQKAKRGVKQGQFCKPCDKKKTKITVLMIAPKLFPQTLPETGCCDIAYIVYYDNWDWVYEQAIQNGWGDDWKGTNVSVWDVDLSGIHGHGFPDPKKGDPLRLDFSGDRGVNGDMANGSVDLAQAVKNAANQKDEVMVCHSQGCNIAIETLKRGCEKK